MAGGIGKRMQPVTFDIPMAMNENVTKMGEKKFPFIFVTVLTTSSS